MSSQDPSPNRLTRRQLEAENQRLRSELEAWQIRAQEAERVLAMLEEGREDGGDFL